MGFVDVMSLYTLWFVDSKWCLILVVFTNYEGYRLWSLSEVDLEILGYVGALICRLFDYYKVEIIVVKICKWLRVS